MVLCFNLGVRALSIERKGPTCRYRNYYGVPEGPINVRIERNSAGLDVHRYCATRRVNITGEILAWFWLGGFKSEFVAVRGEDVLPRARKTFGRTELTMKPPNQNPDAGGSRARGDDSNGV
ncbi:hypothetical protein B0H14DRAFT_2589499 [Mycena olivaceomarginata]|nr:hypothetical protein B0H14DRAFT_2589499 [Mycena olivaceomarginata]